MSTMVLSETRGLWLFWVIRGGIGFTRRLAAKGTCLQALRMLTLEPERLKNRLSTTRTRSLEMDGLFHETLKRIAISIFLPRSLSFFPKCQRNGCDLACQRKACHGWLDALGDRGLIKLPERSGPRWR